MPVYIYICIYILLYIYDPKLFITVSPDALAPNSARPSAGIVNQMTFNLDTSSSSFSGSQWFHILFVSQMMSLKKSHHTSGLIYIIVFSYNCCLHSSFHRKITTLVMSFNYNSSFKHWTIEISSFSRQTSWSYWIWLLFWFLLLVLLFYFRLIYYSVYLHIIHLFLIII